MKMKAGKILSGDMEKVLDVVEYRFEVRQPLSEQSGAQNKIEMSIEFEDLKRSGLDSGPFVSALYSLAERFPEIEIVSVFDFVNEIPETSERTRSFKEIQADLHGTQTGSTLADIKVPLRFKDLLNEARGIKASEHIVIDNTPEGANWPSLQFRFTNGCTLLASFPIHAWHKSMGAGELGLERISGRPKEQWLLLVEAANHAGQIGLLSSRGRKKESTRKQIGSLSKLLKTVFPKLRGEPFEPRGGGEYQTLFEILPEQREDYSE